MKNDNVKKIIISGGGTGGHIFPAIAIANALKAKDRSLEILFVGAQGKIEMEKVPKAGYAIKGLWISGLHRPPVQLRNVLFPVKLGASLVKSWGIINRFKPDVCVGVGGFASGPLLQAATMKGIPSLIQEQNSYPGITNKLLAKRVNKICVAYDGLERFFPKEKMIHTGNPVRKTILDIKGDVAEARAFFGLAPDRKTLLSFGGSLGAKGVNEGIAAQLEKFKAANIQVIWQVGKFYIDWAKEQAKGYEDTIKVMTFIDRMDFAYLAADAIVARAGAGTIAELCVVGKPVVLMPSPNVSEDHQTANAMALVEKQAAMMVKDTEAKEKLFSVVETMLFDKEAQAKLVANIQKLAITNAAERIATEVLNLKK